MARIQASIILLHDFDQNAVSLNDDSLVVRWHQRGSVFGPGDVRRRISLFHTAKPRGILSNAGSGRTLDIGDRGRDFHVEEYRNFRRTWMLGQRNSHFFYSARGFLFTVIQPNRSKGISYLPATFDATQVKFPV